MVTQRFKEVSVVGSGRWGTFLAWYLSKYCAEQVLLMGQAGSPDYEQLVTEHKNEYLELTPNIQLTTDLDQILHNELIVVSVGAQNFRSFCRSIKDQNLQGKIFLLAMKGLEEKSGERLTEVLSEEVCQPNVQATVLVGPGHVQDYVRGVPSCALIDGNDENVKQLVAAYINSDLIRIYYGCDLIGSEIGAALKNVVGLAAGVLDGLGWVGMKGALISRATLEVGRYIASKGGKFRSAYSLAHLGDYEATLFSVHSHNRQYGEALATGKEFTRLAEGVPTLQAVHATQGKISMPICEALYRVIYEHQDIKTNIFQLFERPLKPEFSSLDW